MNKVLAFLFLLPLGCALCAAPSWAQERGAVNTEPTGVLTLSGASAAALARSPILESFSWELRAGDARVLQAGLFPNPVLDAEVEDVAGTGAFSGTKQAQTTLLLSQTLELGGKRAARRDAAGADRVVRGREYELKRVEVLADVADKFITLLSVQHEVALAREATALGEAALRTARERVRAGKVSAIEEKKALVAVSRHRISERDAQHELAVARMQLAATWAGTEAVFDRADGALFHRVPVAQFEELAGRLAAGPEQARWSAEQDLRAAEAHLARIRRIPDVTVGGGVRRIEGSDDTALVFGLSIPLPLADRNQGRYAEAQARERGTEAEARAAAVRVRTVLFALCQELGHAAETLESLEGEIVPLATSTLSLAEQGFRSGRLSYLELLDAQRTFVEVRRERIAVAASYQRLLLGIERLVGAPVQGVSTISPEESDASPTSYQQLLRTMARRPARPVVDTTGLEDQTDR